MNIMVDITVEAEDTITPKDHKMTNEDDDYQTSFIPSENKFLVTKVEHVPGIVLTQNCLLGRVIKASTKSEWSDGIEENDIIMFQRVTSRFELNKEAYYLVDAMDILGTVEQG